MKSPVDYHLSAGDDGPCSLLAARAARLLAALLSIERADRPVLSGRRSCRLTDCRRLHAGRRDHRAGRPHAAGGTGACPRDRASGSQSQPDCDLAARVLSNRMDQFRDVGRAPRLRRGRRRDGAGLRRHLAVSDPRAALSDHILGPLRSGAASRRPPADRFRSRSGRDVPSPHRGAAQSGSGDVLAQDRCRASVHLRPVAQQLAAWP